MRQLDLANIACGGHAGTLQSMRQCVQLACKYGVLIGAHPGLTASFGRGSGFIKSTELIELVRDQTRRLAEVCLSLDAKLHHLKLHGTLYHAVEDDRDLAASLCDFLVDEYPELVVVGRPGGAISSLLPSQKFLAEGFAERGYTRDGRLIPRGQERALLNGVAAIKQGLSLMNEGKVETVSGEVLLLRVDTLCVHSDSPGAHHILTALRAN